MPSAALFSEPLPTRISTTPHTTLPSYLQIAHWLHEQRRFVGAREVAEVFGRPTSTIKQEFSRIRDSFGVVVFHESHRPRKGGVEYLMRITHIYPYRLDEDQKPYREDTAHRHFAAPLIWLDLLCRHWVQLVQMHRYRSDD